MNRPKSIPRIMLLNVTLVAALSTALLGGAWIHQEVSRFRTESERTRDEQLTARRAQLRRQVQDVQDFIAFARRQTMDDARKNLIERVAEACLVAESLYDTYKDRRSLDDIRQMVREALRPMRFNEGRGYFFAVSRDGVEELFATSPHFEGRNLMQFQDSQGQYVVRDMLELAAEQGEGFYKYHWTKPGIPGDDHAKISFIRQCEPLGWIIGAGEYLEDIEADTQQLVLERIERIRFGRDGYVFAGTWEGIGLAGPGKGQDMLDTTVSNGVDVVQQIIDRAQAGGGYITYVMPKFEDMRSEPKLSYAAGIKDWQWYIGAGMYIDDIEENINFARADLRRRLTATTSGIGLLFAALVLMAFLMARRIAQRTQLALGRFTSHLNRAASDLHDMPTHSLEFDELSDLAQSINQMLAQRRKVDDDLRFTQLVVEGSSEAAFWADEHGNLTYVNRAACDSLGYSRSELLAMNVLDVDDRMEHEDWPSFWQTLRAQGSSTFESTQRRKNGERLPVELNVTFQEIAGRDYACAFARDITVRKRAEDALRQSESLLQQAQELASMGSFSYDPEANQTRWSRELFRIYGLDVSASPPMGADHDRLIVDTDVDRVTRAFQRSRETLEPLRVEYRIRRADGVRTLEAEARWNLDADGNPTLLAGVVHDVTEQKKAEATQRELEYQLRQAQKMEAVGQLAGGIAHDFNNLLQAIQGYDDLALTELEESHPAVGDLKELRKAADRAAGLTRQLLAFSRRDTLTPEPLDLNTVVADLMKMLRRVIGENIELAVHPGADLSPIHADHGQIEQVVMNLCVNARDAMRESGRLTIGTCNAELTPDFCRRHPWAQPGNYVRLSVADTGTGIPDEVRDRIFEPFFTTKDVGEGTGLGLATVYAIVKRHEGLIDVDSSAGRGTTFRIYLPVSAGTPEPAIAEPAASAEDPRGGETILLAEDEDLVRGLAAKILRRAGYRLLVATDGGEALRIVQQQADEIDLALLDVVMPKANGRQIAEELHRRAPHVPVLFSSGYSYELLSGKLPAEDAELIQKPYSPSELTGRIRQMLDRTGRRAPLRE